MTPFLATAHPPAAVLATAHAAAALASARGLSLVALLATTALLGSATAQEGGLVSSTRTALEKWTEAKRIASKEAQDWVVGKEAMRARLDVVKREIVTTQKHIGETRGSIAEADKKRDELIADNDRLKATLGSLEQQIQQIEERTLQMLKRLPEPLREKVKPLSQLLPQGTEPTKLRTDERFGNVIAILNELHKWNREISVASEVRALPDGSSVEVTVLYIGLGQAYYVGGNGKVAGTGVATADGFVWKSQNELAADIQRAIAVFKTELPAAYVRLPVQVQ